MCTDDDVNDDANYDGQSIIVQGSLVDKPYEPKILLYATLPNMVCYKSHESLRFKAISLYQVQGVK